MDPKDTYLEEMLFGGGGIFIGKRWIKTRSNTGLRRLDNAFLGAKKKLSKLTSNKEIDELVSLGMNKGAFGAKLLGAGASAFVLFLGDKVFRKR